MKFMQAAFALITIFSLFIVACGDENNYYSGGQDQVASDILSDATDSNDALDTGETTSEFVELDYENQENQEEQEIIQQTEAINTHFLECEEQVWEDLGHCAALCPSDEPQCYDEKFGPCYDNAYLAKDLCYSSVFVPGCQLNLDRESGNDADGDGISDYDEIFLLFLNPCNPCSCGMSQACDIVSDTDGDGLPYLEDPEPTCSQYELHCGGASIRPMQVCD